MACCPKSIIEDVLKKPMTKLPMCILLLAAVLTLACILQNISCRAKAKDLISWPLLLLTSSAMLPRNLWVKTPLLSRSLLPVTLLKPLKAAGIAQKAGAASIVITNKPESPLAQNGDYVLVPEKGSTANSGQAYSLKLAVEILNQTEGYAHYDAMHGRSYERIRRDRSGNATEFIRSQSCRKLGQKMYGDEKLIYVMGSGPNFGVTYSYAICL